MGKEGIGEHLPKDEKHLSVEAMLHININQSLDRLVNGDLIPFL